MNLNNPRSRLGMHNRYAQLVGSMVGSDIGSSSGLGHSVVFLKFPLAASHLRTKLHEKLLYLHNLTIAYFP